MENARSPELRNIAAGLVAVAAASPSGIGVGAVRAAEAVNAVDATLSNFMRDPEMTWLQQNIGRARAVLIAPGDRQGGIHLRRFRRPRAPGRQGRRDSGAARAFYTMAIGTVGFQAGVSASEGITLVMSEKALNSMMAANFKMGGDASVAAGLVGAGAKSDVART